VAILKNKNGRSPLSFVKIGKKKITNYGYRNLTEQA
jgi:hypothetical protein